MQTTRCSARVQNGKVSINNSTGQRGQERALAGHITIHRQACAGFKWVLCDNPNFGMVQQFDIPKLLQTGSEYF